MKRNNPGVAHSKPSTARQQPGRLRNQRQALPSAKARPSASNRPEAPSRPSTWRYAAASGRRRGLLKRLKAQLSASRPQPKAAALSPTLQHTPTNISPSVSLPPEYLDRLIDRATPPVDAQQRETQIMAGRWLALRRLQRELASQQVCERTGLPATALLLLESGLADAALAPASAWRTLDSCLSNGPTDMLVGQVIAIALGQTNHHDSAIVSAIEDDLSFTLMRGSAAIAADELLIKSPQSALRRSRRPRLRLRGCSGWGGLLLTLGSLITMSIFTLLIVSSCSLASLGALAILPAPAIPVAPTAGTGGFTGSDILSCRTASGGLVGCASLALPAPPTPASLIGPPHEHATLLASVGLASPNVLRGAGSWPTAAENSRPVRHPPGALDERARWNLLRYTGAGRLAVVLLSTP